MKTLIKHLFFILSTNTGNAYLLWVTQRVPGALVLNLDGALTMCRDRHGVFNLQTNKGLDHCEHRNLRPAQNHMSDILTASAQTKSQFLLICHEQEPSQPTCEPEPEPSKVDLGQTVCLCVYGSEHKSALTAQTHGTSMKTQSKASV